MLTIQSIVRNQHQQQQYRRLLRLRQHCNHNNSNNNSSSQPVQLSYCCFSNTTGSTNNSDDDDDVSRPHKNNKIYSPKNTTTTKNRGQRSHLNRNGTSHYYNYSTSSIQNSSSSTGNSTSSEGTDTIMKTKKEDNILHSTKKLSYDEIFAYDIEDDEIDDSGPIIPGQYYLDNERKEIQANKKEELYNKQLNDLYDNVLRDPNTLDPDNNKLTRSNMIQQYQKVKQQLHDEHTYNNSIKNKLRIEFSKKSSRYFYNDYDKSESNPNIGADYEQIPDWNTSFISQLANDRIVLYNSTNTNNTTNTTLSEEDTIATASVFSKVPERYEHLTHVPTLHSLVNDVPISLQNNLINNTNPDSSISPDILYKTKLYTLWRKRQQYNSILNTVKPLVYNEYSIISQLDNWDDKQDAIDLLYETIEQQIYDKEIILNKHPLFHKWCVQAIEESLTLIRQYQKKVEMLVQSSNENGAALSTVVLTGTYEEVMNVQFDPVPIFMDCYDPLHDNSKQGKQHKTKNDLIGLVAPVVPKKVVQSYAATDRITIPVPIENGNYLKIVPSILHPLSPTPNTNHVLYTGSMIEEWDLAANKNTKRIMIRNCTKQVASLLYSSLNKQTISLQQQQEEEKSTTTTTTTSTSTPTTRIVIAGRQGVGKTATVASIVASSRKSGCIVLYLPEADRLRKIGYYVEPNEKINEEYEITITKEIFDSNYNDDDDDDDDEDDKNTKKKAKLTEIERTGTYDHKYAEHILYDVPILAQETCMDLLYSHSADFEKFTVSDEHLSQYFYEYQIKRIKEDANSTNKEITLKDLLTVGAQKVYYSSQCYSIAIDILIKQTQQPFIIVIDEYNVFYDPEGFYYHTSYDPTTKKSIPYEQISLFKPLLQIMSLTTDTLYDDEPLNKPKLNINYGAMIVSTTESHAVPRKITDTLLANATTISTLVTNNNKDNNNNNINITSDIGPIPIVTVPKLSNMEVEYMVANYESIGVGMLRIDRGQTLSNQQEIQYLKAVAGNGIAQKLFNACIVPLGNLTLNKV